MSQISKLSKTILLLTLLTTVLYYIILPFLSIFMISNGNVTLSEAGFLIGAFSLSTSISSFFSGAISKGRELNKFLFFSFLLEGIGFLFLGILNFFWGYLISILIIGTASGLYNPLMKSLLSDTKEVSNIVFRIRYMMLCMGIIVGPILSFLLLQFFNQKTLIYIVGILYIFFAVILFFSIKIKESNSTENSVETWKSISIPKVFWSICVLGTLVFIVFSVFESVTPIAQYDFGNANSETTYSILIILNSIIALLLQPLIIKIEEKIDNKCSIYIGSVSFFISYLIFAFTGTSVLFLIFSTLIFTIGEAFMLPSIDILIDIIANKENKATLFSISEIRQIGFFIGPWLASAIIENLGSKYMYLIFSLLCLIVSAVYFVMNIVYKKYIHTEGDKIIE